MSESKDHWSFLAEKVGADVPSQPQAKAQPAVPSSPPPARTRTEPAPAPKRPSGDWNQLASVLGIQAAPEAPKTTQAPPPTPKAEPLAVQAPPESVRPATAPPAQSPPRAPETRPDQKSRQQRAKQPPRERRSRPTRVTEDAVELDWSITSPPPAPEKPRATEELRSRELDRPAEQVQSREREEFEIAESIDVGHEATVDAESTGDAGDRKPARRRRRRRGGRKSGRAAGLSADRGPIGDSPTEELLGDEPQLSGEVDDFVAEALEATDASEDTAESKNSARPKRKRRRRRSGASKRVAGPTADSEAAADEVADGSEEDFDDLEADGSDVERVSQSGSARRQSDEVDEGDDLNHDDEHATRSAARDIPSWQDAIGVIVATNMESRAKSPRNGGQRGRGRGGNRSRPRENGSS